MSLAVIGWVAILEMTLGLILLWNSKRKLENILMQTLNSLNRLRVAVEMTSRSYLGIESLWERSKREMAELGEFGVRDLPPLAGQRMGAVLVQMLDELRNISRSDTKSRE